LREGGTISNPRFGVDRTLGMIMHRLMQFFHADGCALVTVDPLTHVASLRRAAHGEPENAACAELLPAEVADMLMAPHADDAIIYSAEARARWRRARTICRSLRAAMSSAGSGAPREKEDEDPESDQGA